MCTSLLCITNISIFYHCLQTLIVVAKQCHFLYSIEHDLRTWEWFKNSWNIVIWTVLLIDLFLEPDSNSHSHFELLFYVKESFEDFSNVLLLCCMEESKSFGFRTTRGWVNDYFQFWVIYSLKNTGDCIIYVGLLSALPLEILLCFHPRSE